MATIKFQPIGKTENLNIYIRLSISKKEVFRRKTDFTISKTVNWSKKNNLPIANDNEQLKAFCNKLKTFRESIENLYNDAISQNIKVNAEWLQGAINQLHDKKEPENKNRLINYFKIFIKDKKINGNIKTGEPFANATFSKYNTVLNKLIEFEKFTKKEFYIKDIDLNFRRDFVNFLATEKKLSKNNYGKHITVIKTVCTDAQKYNIETSPQLKHIEGARENVESTYLSFDELEQIERKTFLQPYLDNARDWLLIGCYIGQRVSDLLTLTENNVIEKSGVKMIELTQAKTNKIVIIPINHVVQKILDKRNGEFPRKISDQKFNKYIKEVVEIAEINEPTKGSIKQTIKLNGKNVVRKIDGIFPKHQLIVSHICRRSFASNYYSKMPTSLIIKITGHSTESEFLNYVKRPPIDFANEIAEYLHRIYLEQQNKPKLEVRKAN